MGKPSKGFDSMGNPIFNYSPTSPYTTYEDSEPKVPYQPTLEDSKESKEPTDWNTNPQPTEKTLLKKIEETLDIAENARDEVEAQEEAQKAKEHWDSMSEIDQLKARLEDLETRNRELYYSQRLGSVLDKSVTWRAWLTVIGVVFIVVLFIGLLFYASVPHCSGAC